MKSYVNVVVAAGLYRASPLFARYAPFNSHPGRAENLNTPFCREPHSRRVTPRVGGVDVNGPILTSDVEVGSPGSDGLAAALLVGVPTDDTLAIRNWAPASAGVDDDPASMSCIDGLTAVDPMMLTIGSVLLFGVVRLPGTG